MAKKVCKITNGQGQRDYDYKVQERLQGQGDSLSQAGQGYYNFDNFKTSVLVQQLQIKSDSGQEELQLDQLKLC